MENENKNIDKIIDRLQNGVREIFEGDNFKHYLEVMAKFHTFSSYNWQLIYEQCPNATKLAGYVQWKRDFNRHVKKGEKAIRILAPRFGEGGMRGFKEVCIFDISQTEGEELPDGHIPWHNLYGDCKNYDLLFNALVSASPLPVEFEKLKGCDGICYHGRRIALNIGMSQSQNLLTLVHEITHELLHKESKADKNTKEVEAESVAYSVCSYFGIDSSKNSFGYVADWSKDKQLDILRSSLETITKTANKIISDVLSYLDEENIGIDIDTEDDDQRGKELYELGLSYYREENYEGAVEYFEQAAELGYKEAIEILADWYHNGIGVEYNLYEAYKWFERLANLEDNDACCILGNICSEELDIPNYDEAVYWYKKAVELGNYDAYYPLGYCYEYGLGVKADSERSQEYYIEAFLAGYEDAIEAIDSDLIYKKGYSIYRQKKYAESLRYLKIAAELGNVEANYLLGYFYDFGYGVKINYEKAYDYYLFAAENGHAHAQYDVGFAFRYARGIERNLEKAIYWFKKSAALECDAGQYELANCYWDGIGVEEDRGLATEYYLKAYEQGYIKAGYGLVQCYYYGLGIDNTIIKDFIENYINIDKENDDDFLFVLGELYYAGNLVKQDYSKAVKCFEKAKDGCEYHMYYHLAECYFYGLGVKRDLDKAFENYRLAAYNDNIYDKQAFNKMYDLLLQDYWNYKIDDDLIYDITDDAENEYQMAQLMLAKCYYNGYGIDVDYAEALSWREKVAEAGNAQAQFLVAQQYFSGIGTLIDIEKAKHWYTLSAENGNVEAQFELAKLLENGKDVIKKNLAGAFYWYKKAAEADDIYAILKVGQMYDAGIGIGKNIEKALYWYEKAAAKNSIDAIYYLANISLYIHRDIQKCIAGYEKILKLTQNKKMKGLVLTKLGIFYSQGIGVKKDSYKAMHYYRDAVANDSAEAAYLLGNIYLQQKDYGAAKRAVEVFMLGADCGSIVCQKKLADLYLNGIVVQKSKDNAIKWLAEAAKSGDVEAEIKMLELLQSDNESQHDEEKTSEKKADGLNSDMADKLADIFS